MGPGPGVSVDPSNDAGGIDEERRADDAAISPAKRGFIPDDIIAPADRVVLVGQQDERDVQFSDEAVMAWQRVPGNAQDRGIKPGKGRLGL